MKFYNAIKLSFVLIFFFLVNGLSAQLNPVIEMKVSNLLQQMTLEEKVGQMAQVSIEMFGKNNADSFITDPAVINDAVVNYKIGSVLNTPLGILLSATQWNTVIEQFQTAAAKTRLHVPVIYGLDDIHGVNYVKGTTLFPQEIGQAATWNPQLIYNIGLITAYESRAAGVPWTFSPVLDLGTNPQWPRIWEGYGEDPYLISEMGVQFVKAAQFPLGAKDKVSVSLKHYMAYSDPKSGKDRTDAWIPEHYLREYHLPPFAAAVKAGARNIMVNSALINGVPTHINKHLLTDILKGELGFTGFVCTDWQDIENVCKRDKITATIKDAIALAINAGNDMSMIPHDYKEFCTDLVALVKEGKVPMSRINDAVTRILRVKYELDLFNTPMTYAKDYPKMNCDEFKKASYNTAAESITLLKNTNNILPIAKNAKLLITGPNANSMRCLNGGWTYTWQGELTDKLTPKFNTILDALTNKFGKDNVIYQQGVAYNQQGKYFEDSIVNIDAAVAAAKNVDCIILCIGENSYTETPGNLNDLNLSDNQLALATALSKTGKPIVFILNEGRPRIISRVEPFASAILHVYLPGSYGADALADILTGDVNPSGKLPVTYPRYSNALTNYIHKPSDGPDNQQGGDFDPQFHFGYGLSYTTFEYSNIIINKNSFTTDEIADITVVVKNTGAKEGKEVVQLFTSDVIASITPDVKRLRRFQKIDLKPGESQTVEFKLPVKELAYINLANKKELEAGEFKAMIAGQAVSFTVNKTIIF